MDEGYFKGYHMAIAIAATAVLTASFAPSPSTSDEWIHCEDLRESVDREYEGTVYSSHIYFETKGGHEGLDGANFLLSWDNASMSQNVPFEFTETIRVRCEDGQIRLWNFIWPAKETELTDYWHNSTDLQTNNGGES